MWRLGLVVDIFTAEVYFPYSVLKQYFYSPIIIITEYGHFYHSMALLSVVSFADIYNHRDFVRLGRKAATSYQIFNRREH